MGVGIVIGKSCAAHLKCIVDVVGIVFYLVVGVLNAPLSHSLLVHALCGICNVLAARHKADGDAVGIIDGGDCKLVVDHTGACPVFCRVLFHVQLVHIGYRRHPHFTAYVSLEPHKHWYFRDMSLRLNECFRVVNTECHASIVVDVCKYSVFVVIGKVGHRCIEYGAVFQQVIASVNKPFLLSSHIVHNSDERYRQVVISALQH